MFSAPVRRVVPLLLSAALVACAAEENPEADSEVAEMPAPATPNGSGSVLGDMDVSGLAQRVVAQSARVGEGQKVLITGSARDLPLLEELAVQVRRVGAFPLLSVTSEELEHRLVKDVPEQYDTQRPELGLALVQLFDVNLSVDYGETPGLFRDISPERLARRAQAAAPVMEAVLKRGTRAVNIGNAMYPNAAAAERLGVEQAALRSMFVNAVGTDPAMLQARGDSLKRLLSAGRTLHITHPNGTDLRVQIAGRPVQVSDGAISPQDEAAGPAGRAVWLPAGEVYFTPVAGTAEGRVIADRVRYEGEWIEGLTLDFRQGRLATMTARSGDQRLQAAYAAADPGKDQLGVIDFGINPAVTLPATAPGIWVADGFISLVVGNDTWAGGQNQTSFAQQVHLGGATVKVDERTIVDAGKLVLR